MNIMNFPFKIPLSASLTWPLTTISQSRMEGRGGREDDMNDVVGAGGMEAEARARSRGVALHEHSLKQPHLHLPLKDGEREWGSLA